MLVNPKPATPSLSVDNELNLVSTAAKNEWYFNGTLINETAQKIKPNLFGIYTAVALENGCLSQTSDGFNYVITATRKEYDKTYIAYPNPFQDAIKIDFSAEEVDIEIFNALGSKVFSKNGLKSGEAVKTSNLQAGAYILFLHEKEKPVQVLKIWKY